MSGVRGSNHHTDEEIIRDMRIAAAACPRGELSEKRYDKYGRYKSRTAANRFGSWDEAMRLALPHIYARKHPTPEQLIADLHRVADLCRRELARIAAVGVPAIAGKTRYNTIYHTAKVRKLSKAFYDQHGAYGHTFVLTHLGEEHLKVRGWTALKHAIGIHDI